MERGRFIRSFDCTELYIYEIGNGPITLILCDGLGCDGFVWRYLVQYFAPCFRIVRWHYRGHGLSKIPVSADNMTFTAVRNDLKQIFKALAIDKAILIGHSLGCQVILDFALHFPDQVLALIPICGSFGSPLNTFHNCKLLGRVFWFLHAAVETWPYFTRRWWQRIVTSEIVFYLSMHYEVNPHLLQRVDLKAYFRHLAEMDLLSFVRLAQSANNHTMLDQLVNITIPTLIVAGTNDTFTPMKLSCHMHKLLPNSKLLIVPEGTHLALLEKHELVHKNISRFINKLA
ncbi:MAG: alpha/beta hydrolase [Deltaproteobacteria bacterium]|nr:alpha/beta hydrolase [Deltaproteobacteria bacterium]